VAGQALPVRHYGSVDIFLEAMLQAKPGDILCIDDRGRNDQACIGDLTALEAMSYGIAAIACLGLSQRHRRASAHWFANIQLWKTSIGPAEARACSSLNSIGSAELARTTIDSNDFVFIDSDGAVFVQQDHIKDVFATAKQICEVESKQAQLVRDGQNLHRQLMFDDYLKKRVIEPTHTFREHLRALAKSIEE
jgi:4-hydroxy-4-methyl-2-oxoglutarate aldolase